MRSGAFESCVSSKSIAWPAVPLARAASGAGTRVSGGPKMVASACPPCAAIWSCTMREQASVDPARITPVPSSTQRRPSLSSRSGKSPMFVLRMKSMTARVALTLAPLPVVFRKRDGS